MCNASLDDLLAVGFQRLIFLSEYDRRFAVMLSLLSGSETHALHWVRLRQQQLDRWRCGWAEDVTTATLERWRSEFTCDSVLLRALREPSCCLRAEAHTFLTESVLAEHVTSTNAGGLAVPSGYVVQRFVQLLSALPQASPVRDLRERLSTNPNARKKWMQRFRRRWSLQWGDRCVPHGIGITVQDRRAGVFFRWFRWAAESMTGAEVIVVNMDETNLGNVRPSSKGNLTSSSGVAHVAHAIVRRQRPVPRTSLIASICSDGALQRILPQVRLPSGCRDKIPGCAVQTAYAKAGPPQVARHGGTGWVGASVLRWWLPALRRAVTTERPGARILLVWDCAPTHISAEVLEVAKRLGIRVVLIPCKMTWRLQPLDTHVFSRLKHCMRTLEFAARAHAPRGTLPPLRKVELQGDAIRTTLVETSWARTVQRSGLSPRPGVVRDSLKELYQWSISRPAPPQAEDLQDSLMVPASRLVPLGELLFWSDPSPSVVPPAGGAASSAPPVQEVVVTPAAGSRSAWSVLRLPMTARLGATLPRPARGENHWAPRVLLDRVVTRSMTSSQSAGASLSTTAGVLERPAKRRRGG